MLGMCCGFSDERCASPSKLGDVIVARETASWEEGKYIELVRGDRAFFRKRPVIRAIDDVFRVPVTSAIEGAADHIAPYYSRFLSSASSKELRRKYFGKIRDRPEVKLGMLVSGSSVIADEKMIGEILDRNPAAIGLDMEIFGVYTAAQKCLEQKPSVVGIKGVADFGTVEKHDDIQEYASVMSLFVLLGILNKCYRDDYISAVQ
jgi:nucleoside phosphorylase